MNIITIGGRLGLDPEVRFTSNGQKVTTFRVATNSRRSAKDETIWWRVTVWGDHFDRMISYLKKGSAVVIVGDLSKPEIFTDREGKPQVSMNITASNIMFSPFGRTDKPADSVSGGAPKAENTQNVEPNQEAVEYVSFTPGAKEETQGSEFSDDEIPF